MWLTAEHCFFYVVWQAWAINLARGPFWEGHDWRRAVFP